MLHLYGTREDTKIWAKITSLHAKKCSRMKVSVAEERWAGQKGNSKQTSWGMNALKNDHQCGERTSTVFNTHGYYGGL